MKVIILSCKAYNMLLFCGYVKIMENCTFNLGIETDMEALFGTWGCKVVDKLKNLRIEVMVL